MTITFPREFPIKRLTECTFELLDGVVVSPSANGKFLNRSQTSDPVWKGKFSTPPLNKEDRAIWGAWKKSLRGGLNTFRTYDLTKSPPRAYPTASAVTDISSTWSGFAVVTSLGAGGVLGLSGLPAGYKAMTGDHVSVEQSGRYGLYEILEDATATGGGVLTLTVAPFLHTSIFTTAAQARLWRARAQFVLDWQSWQEQATLNPTPISFEGYQVL